MCLGSSHNGNVLFSLSVWFFFFFFTDEVSTLQWRTKMQSMCLVETMGEKQIWALNKIDRDKKSLDGIDCNWTYSFHGMFTTPLWISWEYFSFMPFKIDATDGRICLMMSFATMSKNVHGEGKRIFQLCFSVNCGITIYVHVQSAYQMLILSSL